MMMPRTVFRFTLTYRLMLVLTTLVLLVFVIWFRVAFLPIPWVSFGKGLVEILSLLLILVPLWVGYMAVFSWTYRLELGEQHVRTRHVYHPFQGLFHCSYDDVVQVRRVRQPSVLQIIPRKGKPLQVHMGMLEGGEEKLLDELAKRVDSSRFHANIQVPSELRKRFTRLRSTATATVLLILCGWLYLQLGHRYVLTQIAWKSVGRQYFLSNIEAFSLDDDGAPWFVVRSGTNGRYRVQHVTDAGAQVGDMPAEAADWDAYGRPIGIAWDQAGSPLVLYREHLFRRVGETWQITPFPPDDLELEILEFGLATRGAKLWSLAYSPETSENHLLEMDLASGEWRLVPLPDAAVQSGQPVSRFRLLADGSLLVLVDGQDLYLYQGDRWQDSGDPVRAQAPGPIQDFTMDSSGQIWVLTTSFLNQPSLLGRFDRATATWHWSQLEPPDAGAELQYTSMQVDAHGRVWLAGRDESRGSWQHQDVVDILEPVQGGVTRRLVRYTRDNSNYQRSYGNELRLGSDGRMWGAGDRLVWIDSNASNLPRPLPDWVEIVTSIPAVFVWFACGFIAMVILAACVGRQQRILENM